MPPLAPRQPLPQQQLESSSAIKSPLLFQTDTNPTTRPTAEMTTTTTHIPPGSPADTIISIDSALGRSTVSFDSVSTIKDSSRSTTPIPQKVSVTAAIASKSLSSRCIIDEDQPSTEFGSKPLPGKSQKMGSLSERSQAMQLYSSYQLVLACQEAMWEELKDRIRNRREELVRFGWDDDEELEELSESRKKFEKLIERYQS